jgi:hypothetical protein
VHAIDITTGVPKVPSSLISGTVPGTGVPKTGTNTIKFDPYWLWQRAALLLSNNILYVGFGTQDENGRPAHGWMFSFDASTLQQTAYFNATPDGAVGSFWSSGAGPGADAAGNVFAVTGNGDFNGLTNWGESVLRINSVPGQGMKINDSFTPSTFATLNQFDRDLGSGGVVMIPDPPGTTSTIFPHLAMAAGKSGDVFVLNRDDLGGLGNDLQIVQKLSMGKPIFVSPAYWNERIYYLPNSTNYSYFTRGSDGFLTGPVTGISGQGGANFSISANGNTDGLLWQTTSGGTFTGTLTAVNATTIAQAYTSSSAAGNRDFVGPTSKWNAPTVSNGKVYVGGKTYLAIYGLLP